MNQLARVEITFPSVLSSIVRGERRVDVQATTVQEAIQQLVSRYGENFKIRILDSSGKPNRLLNFYVNGKNVKFLSDIQTSLRDGDEITLIPAVAGG